MGIISGRIHGWQTLLGLIEIAAAAALFGGLVSAWDSFFPLVKGVYAQYLLIVILSLLVSNTWTIRKAELLSAVADSHIIRQTLGKTLIVAVVWLGFLVAFRDHSVSRKFLFVYLLFLPFILILIRLLAHHFLIPMVFSKKHRFSVILLGEPSADDALIAWLLSKKDMGIQVLGYLTPSGLPTTDTIRHLGACDDLAGIVKKMQAQLVVSLLFPVNNDHAIQLRELCDRLGVRLAYHCCLGGSTSRISICQSDGVSLLSVRSEPLQNPFNRFIKRVLDLFIAIPVALLVLPWLAVLVWAIHRVYSPGPLFFRQKRGGLAGRPFMMLKFRTMHCSGHDEAMQARHGDERVFRGGRWLRKFSIDEFPQFLNVITGEMSVVGPRPHLEAHDEAFSEVSPEYRVRSLVKPGITGLAQVQGFRGPTPMNSQIEERVRADLHYLENWTLTFDLMLLARTFFQLIRPKNAV